MPTSLCCLNVGSRLRRSSPEFVALDKTVGRTDGAIPRKYRELMALAVAFTTQCLYCLDVHAALAKRAGARREEVAETAFIAAALRARAAVTHGTLALKLFDAAR
jgi:AhpD family alkylhydroperoxidase